ncbi:SAM-dependent methyltransferase [Lactobacillus sp.]|uniref:SAM-dependent methyltransferase n=1 Tax=Lactobacillus sp. TaxID=1591 RepID=UPI0019C4238D|nr:SAM-dependent methyltransferase [Lactobacillus sp.]MBD5429362.1 SAM-dependent methyltransferase [Lactobacillus sp.]
MTDYKELLVSIDKKLNISCLHQQVQEVVNILNCLDKKDILPKAPAHIGFLPDEYDELFWKVSSEERVLLKQADNLLNNFRSYLSRSYGLWSLANLKTARIIKDQYQVNTSLEVMGGNSYWSAAFDRIGVQAVSTDSMSWAKTSNTGNHRFYKTEQLDAQNAIKKYREVDLVICCWAPNFGDSDLEVLTAFRKYNTHGILLFIGEKDGATNTAKFWEHARIISSSKIRQVNQTFPNFDFIDEKIYEIK